MNRLLARLGLLCVILLGPGLTGCDPATSQALEGVLTTAASSLIDSAFQDMFPTPSTYTPVIPNTTSTLPTSPGSLLPPIEVPTINIPSTSVSTGQN